MSRLRPVPARRMVQFLKSLGFSQIRRRGSHRFFAHPDGRTATVPDHRAEDLGRGIIRSILRDVDVTPKEFARWLNS
ncbi:MAG: type II toxin-antitoxin system HicA family toxin [Phycisphaerae bacterium]